MDMLEEAAKDIKHEPIVGFSKEKDDDVDMECKGHRGNYDVDVDMEVGEDCGADDLDDVCEDNEQEDGSHQI